jgi:hypothetical protein
MVDWFASLPPIAFTALAVMVVFTGFLALVGVELAAGAVRQSRR